MTGFGRIGCRAALLVLVLVGTGAGAGGGDGADRRSAVLGPGAEDGGPERHGRERRGRDAPWRPEGKTAARRQGPQYPETVSTPTLNLETPNRRTEFETRENYENIRFETRDREHDGLWIHRSHIRK